MCVRQPYEAHSKRCKWYEPTNVPAAGRTFGSENSGSLPTKLRMPAACSNSIAHPNVLISNPGDKNDYHIHVGTVDRSLEALVVILSTKERTGPADPVMAAQTH